MNRKLQHTMTALSATAAVLGLMLLAGAPPQPVQPDFAVFAASASQDAVAPDTGMADAAGTEADTAAAPRAAHARRARSALALPYFSIAQGLRRATGS
ncbi:MAG TPA: hypothetical protein VL118_02030 [Luteimonas sp.]|nr:hypothetical protein [Luteimonas sp.]